MPAIPDSIHVSYSQLGTWRRCRRKWHFGYVGGYKSAQPTYALWLGSGVHEALDAYYSDITRDPLTLLHRFKQWHDEGKKDIEEKIKGLVNAPQILMDLKKNYDLGMDMLTNYGSVAPELDKDFYVLETEQAFDLSLGVTVRLPDDDGVLHEVPVTYRGRIDGVIQMKDTGDLFLLEHKTASSYNEKKLILDQQATSYIWAAQQLTGQPIAGVYYNIIRKQANTSRVKTPLVYRLSVDRTKAAIDGFAQHVCMIVKDMELARLNNLYYHTPGEDCNWCEYFTPCSMIQDEADPTEYMEYYYKQEKPSEDADTVIADG